MYIHMYILCVHTIERRIKIPGFDQACLKRAV